MLKKLLLLLSISGLQATVKAGHILGKLGQTARTQAPALRRGISYTKSQLSPLAQEVENTAQSKVKEILHSSHVKNTEQKIKEIAELPHLDERSKTVLMQRALRSQDATMRMNNLAQNAQKTVKVSPRVQEVLHTVVKAKITPAKIEVPQVKEHALKMQLEKLEQKILSLENKVGTTTSAYWEKAKTFMKRGSASFLSHLATSHLGLF